ncbi:hypothetical protein [Agrococcus jejuensis]|uniref:PH domain-containing protein n=1 Tax=Agrococcus jejuensis TaxID=399736 RepID=A0A1G8ESU6_9MICO|nr:hypothetical protein [Agrococcus jejuensis]SDH72914.1 hypothetical protein SAMN04489720_2175 [Agrococcus jejuensis]
MAATGTSTPEAGRTGRRLRLADVLPEVGRSRHDATHAASARAVRWPVLLRSALPTVLVGMPIVLDLAGVHVEAALVSIWTIAPAAIGLVIVVALAAVRAARGDVTVADGGVRVAGWPAFDVADVHEVLPVAWRDHAAERRVDLALIAADGGQLALLDGARYRGVDLVSVLGTLAGRVRPPVRTHLANARRLRGAHPQALDHRDARLAAIQWFTTIVGLLSSAVASFVALA